MNASRMLPLLLLIATPGSAGTAEESVTPLAREALPGVPGKQFTAAIVTFLPGARAAPHRHGTAFLYAYVLEGTVRSQLEGGPLQTYAIGQSWIEQPGVHHLVTENASTTKPARLLVTFVSDTGAPLKTRDGN